MATVIDKLVVELGLDPSKFTQGQKDALASFKKTQEGAADTAKNIEQHGKRAAQFFSNIRGQVLGLLALFVGGRGIKEFVTQVTTADAQVGRLATRLGTSTEVLSAWRGAAVIAGGSAEGITGTIRNLVQQFNQFAITGESSVVPYFRALGVTLSDTRGKMRPFSDILKDLHDRFVKMNDPARAHAFGAAMGIDEETVNLLLRTDGAFEKLIADQKRLGITTTDQSDAAQKLYEKWGAAEQAATSLGRAILNDLSPALGAATDKFTLFFEGMREKFLPDLKTALDRLGELARKGGLLEIFDPRRIWREAPGETQQAHPGTSPSSSLRVKPGAGETSEATRALATVLQNEFPGLKQFTSFNDDHHGGAGGHGAGRALDFTLADASQSTAVAERIRQRLRDMQVRGTVLDEYRNPSPGSTGGHIHVQFNSEEAARKFAAATGLSQSMQPTSEAAARSAGAISSALGNVDNSRSSSSRSQTTIDKVIVQTQATDAAGIARDMKAAVERDSFTAHGQSGPN